MSLRSHVLRSRALGLAWRSPWLTCRRAAVALVALLLLIPNSSVLEHRAMVGVFLLALFTGRGRVFVVDWLPLVGAAAGFVALRQLASLSPLPHQGEAVAHMEVTLFGGVMPSAWLQARLYLPGHAGWLDYAATAIHASYFFGFAFVGLGLWLWAHEQFARYVRVLAVVFALGLAGYALAPTEPPWLAARESWGPPVHRILAETARGTRLTAGIVAAGEQWQHDPEALGDPNPTAAMPSVHTAVTVALAIVLARVHPALGTLGAIYALAMGFSLVYLGEHYVLDVMVGVACALAAMWIVDRVAGYQCTSPWWEWRATSAPRRGGTWPPAPASPH